MPESTSVPPYARLLEMSVWAHHRSHMLESAVDLELADHLGDQTLSAGELADLTQTQPRLLYRFLRALCSLGIFLEHEDRRFSLTELGQALREGAPGAAKSAIFMLSREENHRSWNMLTHTLRTGETACNAANDRNFFDIIAERPEYAARFSETMISLSNTEPPAIAEAYDFSRYSCIVDVGAATGYLLAAILERYPQPQAILFDMPHVVRDAPALLEQHNVSDRVSISSGSFFDSVPAGGDLYVLSHIIHDWSEALALKILRNCREHMQENARLLLIEHVLVNTNAPSMGTLLDISMMVNLGGEERTAGEYAELLAKAGFRLESVIATASPSSIIEAVPA